MRRDLFTYQTYRELDILWLLNKKRRLKHKQLPTELDTAQKMKFSNKKFFSKCYQIRSFLRIWTHLLKKSLMENFIFCAVIHIKIGSSYFYTSIYERIGFCGWSDVFQPEILGICYL